MKQLLPSLIVALPIAFLVAPSAAAQSTPPELFRKAFAAPAKVQLYAYDFLDQRAGDKPGHIRGRVDPSKPEGERVTILEATGDKVDLKKIDKRYEKNADGEIWCDKLTGGVDGEVTETGANEAGRLFAFRPLPKPDAEGEEKKLYKQLAAVVAIDEATASIRTFTATLTAPWKPMVIAKLDTMEMKGVCEPAPDGRAYHSRLETRVVGSALGSAFSQDMTSTISNLTPVG